MKNWKNLLLMALFWMCWNFLPSNCYERLTPLESSALNPALYPQLIENLSAKLAAKEAAEDKSTEEEKPTGELSAKIKCLHRLNWKMENGVTTALSGLVGVGWDDLTNKITLPVFPTKYLKCKTTLDGHFLIPDNVLAMPIQEVIIDRTARSYKSYNDIEKENIKATRDQGFAMFVGGGTYANGNQEIKKIFSNGHTSMLEAKIGYKAFTFIAEPNEGLDPVFKDKIEEIIKSYESYLPFLAVYQAECLIRDYGTHVVNKVLTGALIRYRIFVKNAESHTHAADIRTSQSDTSVNILGIFGTDVKEETRQQKEEREGFEKNIQYSIIETKGGPDVRSILGAQTEKNMMRMDNLVGLEHEGVPLYSVIHGSYFPDYNASLLLAVQDIITNATKMYYQKNTAVGCMDPSFPNYDYMANIQNDDSCNATERKLVFNGFFQTCEVLKARFRTESGTFYQYFQDTPGDDICARYTLKHPKMPAMTCPENYEPEFLVSAIHEDIQHEICRKKPVCSGGILGWFETCRTRTNHYFIDERVHTTAFWCRPKEGAAAAPDGMLFGGLYLDGEENVFTKTKGCPEYYEPYKFFGTVYICISLNHNHLGAKHAIDFGGFFSCYSQRKSCPSGFTAHLLTTYSGCPVHYCVHPSAFKKALPTPLMRPPFSDFHKAIKNQTSDDTDIVPKMAPRRLTNETIDTLQRWFNVTHLFQKFTI